MKDPFYKLMLVTQRGDMPTPEYLSFIKTCAQAGITSLQLREKYASHAECLDLGLRLKAVLAPYSIPLIVNDSLELALEIGADGLHLGQSDGCPKEARAALGSDKILGLSIESIPQLKAANALSLNYVGISAIFPSAHKDNLSTIWGLKGLRKTARHSRHPMVGIGGIHATNAADVMASGAGGVAVIGAIHAAKDPAGAVQELKRALSPMPANR